MSEPDPADLDLQQLIEAGLVDPAAPDPTPRQVTRREDPNHVEPGKEYGE